MAEGWSAAAANSALDTWGAAWPFMQLHTAAPGAAGTSTPATETTRKEVTWGTAAGGAMTSVTTALTWTDVAGTEDYAFCSMWSLASAGTFGGSGSITANPVNAGDTFTIAVGDVDASLAIAS